MYLFCVIFTLSPSIYVPSFLPVLKNQNYSWHRQFSCLDNSCQLSFGNMFQREQINDCEMSWLCLEGNNTCIFFISFSPSFFLWKRNKEEEKRWEAQCFGLVTSESRTELTIHYKRKERENGEKKEKNGWGRNGMGEFLRRQMNLNIRIHDYDDGNEWS